MKKAFFIAAAIMLGIMSIHAQIADPVTWTFTTENVNGDEAELVFKADIEPPWHLYSAFLPSGGPIATKPWFNESDQYELVFDELPREMDKGIKYSLNRMVIPNY